MADSVFAGARDSELGFEMKRKASFSRLMAQNVERKHGILEEGDKSESLRKNEKMWELMASYIPVSEEAIQRGIINHVEYTLARTRFNFDKEDCYRATAFSIRDRLIETLNDTATHFFAADVKRCYYLSLEFLLGRALQNALVNLDLEDDYRAALIDLGYNLEELYRFEHDPALGNGGLGRLAACFLDSMATLNLPCGGYGIRYTYGIFEQKIVDGRQIEHPDYWLVTDNPWEICRHDIAYAVRFYGEVKTYKENGSDTMRYRWTGGTIVQAVAYDNPIPGFDTFNCINLRLWKAAPSREFDFNSFNAGKYLESITERQNAEAISAVLYPNDNTLQQQYFFCCATIQDALRRYRRKPGREWKDLPTKIVIQLNDTHPTIAIPELMRILIDVENLPYETAWDITKNIFNYTNHTVLPEALERWPQSLIETLLPRHILIINDINFHFLTEVRQTWQHVSNHVIAKLSIYEEGWEKMVRMANLAIVGSKKVNGVAALHSDILQRELFCEFKHFFALKGEKDKIINKTNGVTPRRWIHCANRKLSNLISEWLGSDDWLKDLNNLKGLLKYKDDKELKTALQEVKFDAKQRLAQWVAETCGIQIDPYKMMFDIQVKRIHEYKRQLMNLFYVAYRYLKLKKMPAEERKSIQPRACMMGGKAAPGYFTAKTIIKMANCLSDIVNQDSDVADYLKVVFLPNYNVSSATIIIPASDISHQISTAGTEASGTSCMKFVMNGGLILGTLDGANVEIRQECGEDTMFVFGLRDRDIDSARADAKRGNYPIDSRLAEVFHWIRSGALAHGDWGAHAEFAGLVDRISNNGNGNNGDFYLIIKDFPDFCRAQEEVDKTYQDADRWTSLCIKAMANMGKFSSDRTIQEYADEIWGIAPTKSEPPGPIPEADKAEADKRKHGKEELGKEELDIGCVPEITNRTLADKRTVFNSDSS